jgi:hypothetical protein
MGGSFGGMMMRHAMRLGMGGVSSGLQKSESVPADVSWARIVDRETKHELERIKRERESDRDHAIDTFQVLLLRHQQELYDAGLLKDGDTLYKILCRAAGIPYRKRKRRNGKG